MSSMSFGMRLRPWGMACAGLLCVYCIAIMHIQHVTAPSRIAVGVDRKNVS